MTTQRLLPIQNLLIIHESIKTVVFDTNDDLRYYISFDGSGAVEFGPSLRHYI